VIGWLWRAIGASSPPAAPPPDLDVTLEAFAGPLPAIPTMRTEVYRVYGNPGSGSVDKRWAREHMVLAENLPGRWNGGKGRLYVHRLAEPYLREALRRCRSQGVLEEIERLGCFEFRHQRHDPARPLSYHSWGIACDLNSAQNAARSFPRGQGPDPFSAEWRRLWPEGLSEPLVRCWESVGWSWGGRWATFPDPMHFELVA
jgi:hypothetical protein